MTWLDVLAPLMVVGLMSMIFFMMVTATGPSHTTHRRPFPPTQRGIAAAGRLWRRRWRKLTPWTVYPSPPSWI